MARFFRFAKRSTQPLALLLGAAMVTGCEDFPGGSSEPSAQINTTSGQLRIEERDVEAPDVFSLRSRGLWDGRPSLGGVWVAVPQNVEPDRVRITNLDNGKSVEGGLFRKEVANPGPDILVSSDAAAAIGMQAGAPAEMEIVVLRRETVEIAPPVPITQLDPPPAEEDAEDSGALVAAEAPGQPEPIAETPSAVAAAGDISTESLETAVAAAIAETASEAAEAAPAPAEAPAASSLDRPYIQVATLSSPANANDIIKTLQKEGLSGELRVGKSAGKTIFSVVIGPAQTKAERTETLNKVRKLGFKDAYPV